MLFHKLQGAGVYQRDRIIRAAMSINTTPSESEAPDGSILFITQLSINYDSSVPIPTLPTGYTSLYADTQARGPTGAPYSVTWYYSQRISWAVASSATRSVSPSASATYPFSAFYYVPFRSEKGVPLTLTSSSSTVDFNTKRSPSTLISILPGSIMFLNVVGSTPVDEVNEMFLSNYISIDGVPYGNTEVNGGFRTASYSPEDSNGDFAVFPSTYILTGPPTDRPGGEVFTEDLTNTGTRVASVSAHPQNIQTPTYYTIEPL